MVVVCEMDGKSAGRRFTLLKQSSLAPDRRSREDSDAYQEDLDGVSSKLRLLYLANEGDLDGIKEVLESGVDVNFRDIDDRTALHIAACHGSKDVVSLLLENGAEIDRKDRWGSTPLADAINYKNQEVIKMLEERGAKPLMAPMHVKHPREVPEYEINSDELDLTNSVEITKGTFRMASWRGIQVAVKILGEEVLSDEEKVQAFRDELALLQKIRHPNVVQFLGAVTQSSPMMIVTEYLPKPLALFHSDIPELLVEHKVSLSSTMKNHEIGQNESINCYYMPFQLGIGQVELCLHIVSFSFLWQGDLFAFLKRKGALKPIVAVKFALDIARGMSYLHENRPPIIHCDLEPSNILRDDSGHLKVADFGFSKYLTVKKDRPFTLEDASCRYVAPEVFKSQEYDTKVDVFSFALILQEMIEGTPPFSAKQATEVAKSYAAQERPPFRAPTKRYAHGLRNLIEDCWNKDPAKRPTFRQIITKLESTFNTMNRRRRWKVKPLKCFQNLEAIFKRDLSLNGGSRSSRSTRST